MTPSPPGTLQYLGNQSGAARPPTMLEHCWGEKPTTVKGGSVLQNGARPCVRNSNKRVLAPASRYGRSSRLSHQTTPFVSLIRKDCIQHRPLPMMLKRQDDNITEAPATQANTGEVVPSQAVDASLPVDPSSIPGETRSLPIDSSSQGSSTTATSWTPTNSLDPEPTTEKQTTEVVSSITASLTVESPESSLSATSTASIPSSSSGISGGAVAGIAIGCILAGLFIGAIAVWLLFWRRRRRLDNSRSKFVSVTVSRDTKASYNPPSSSPPPIQDSLLDKFLLCATPDREIQDEMQSLCELIHQHVDNSYDLQATNISALHLTQSLRELEYTEESGLSAEKVAAMCINPSTRTMGLRHIISHVLFKSIDIASRSSLSMLPAPVAIFLQSIPASGRNGGDPAGMYP